MRSFVVMAMFVASFAHAAWNDYTEERDLELDAGDIDALEIKAGAGSMDVRGVSGDRIHVKATIVLSNVDDDDAADIIEKRMTLTLEERGGNALLEADFDDGWMGWSEGARIDLEVAVPVGTALRIDDGSGSIDVTGVEADVSIDDGSGSLDVRDVGSVVIEDGSGSIDVANASGDVSITDGSGSISVRSVAGSVTIDDGSGSIKVNDVEKDLILVDDGSGSFKYSNVRGRVEQET